MAQVKQEVYIKWGLGTPRLKGRLHPIIMAPIRAIIKPFVKDKLPLYIDPLPLKLFVPEPVEPPLKKQIEDIIPLYIGDPDGQQEKLRQAPADEPTSDQDGETSADVEDTPRTL